MAEDKELSLIPVMKILVTEKDSTANDWIKLYAAATVEGVKLVKEQIEQGQKAVSLLYKMKQYYEDNIKEKK